MTYLPQTDLPINITSEPCATACCLEPVLCSVFKVGGSEVTEKSTQDNLLTTVVTEKAKYQ